MLFHMFAGIKHPIYVYNINFSFKTIIDELIKMTKYLFNRAFALKKISRSCTYCKRSSQTLNISVFQ